MTLKLILIPRALDTSITPRLRKSQLHGLIKQLKALHLLDRLLRALYRIKDDKRLSLGFQIRLGHDVDYGAVFREELCESFFQLLGLDALFEVARVDSKGWLDGDVEGGGTCRSAMTRTLRLVVGKPL